MCRTRYVLAVVAMFIGVAHSWNFAVSLGDQLMFYTDDGNKTDTVNLESRNLGSLAYDEVHDMMLYVDKQNNNDTICGYKLSSKQNVCYTQRNGRNIHSITYDPVTEVLFFTDTNEKSINWISLKGGSDNNITENLFIKMDERTPTDVAVDSCGGYIYWSNPHIERVRFNGSGREDLTHSYFVHRGVNFTIDPQARTLYHFNSLVPALWSFNTTEKKYSYVTSAKHESSCLTISKDYIYWMSSSEGYKNVWQYPRNSDSSLLLKHESLKFYSNKSLSIAANYKILDEVKENLDCESLSTNTPAIGIIDVQLFKEIKTIPAPLPGHSPWIPGFP